MRELIDNANRINIADKFIFYWTSLCCLICWRFEVNFPLNFAMGFVAGGAIFNFLLNYAVVKSVLKEEVPARQYASKPANEED